MHTKHSPLLKIRTAAALCAALFLCACSYERIPDDDDGNTGQNGELTAVTLKVDPTAGEQNLATKGLSDEQENAIHNLYILAFQPDNSDTETYKLEYYATGKPGAGGNFNFTLRRSASGAADTKLLLIANFNPFPQVNTDMTYEGVQAALTSRVLLAAPAFAGIGIPMFGYAGNNPDQSLEITDNMPPLTAKLLRAVARVDVGVGTYNQQSGEWEKGNVSFDLSHVYVFKPLNKYTLIPLIDNLEYKTGGIPSVTAPSPAGTSSSSNFEYTGAAITNATSCKSEIYIPEVDFEGGIIYDAHHNERMALVIGGTYNGKTNYYRIDFTDQPTNVAGTALQDVLRNHIYRFSITNVNLPGYDTPEKAYLSKPVGLSFTASITDWNTGMTGSPNPDMLVRMNFGGINGTIVEGTMIEEGVSKTITIKGKTTYFIADNGYQKSMLYYNALLGEAADNTFNGTGNGGQYRGVTDAFNREGPYAKLVIAPDNAAENVVWKTGTTKRDRVLVAKKTCWDYRGQGQTDWRLPRLSELCLLWLNKETINQSKGFTSLGVTSEAYWSATEGGQEDKAYAVNAAGEITLNAKSNTFSIRCVREVR